MDRVSEEYVWSNTWTEWVKRWDGELVLRELGGWAEQCALRWFEDGENGGWPVGKENSRIQCEMCEAERKAMNGMDGRMVLNERWMKRGMSRLRKDDYAWQTWMECSGECMFKQSEEFGRLTPRLGYNKLWFVISNLVQPGNDIRYIRNSL